MPRVDVSISSCGRDIQHWTALRSHFADLKNALDAVKEHDAAKGITALGVMSYLDAMGHSNICNLGGAAPGLAEGNLMFTAMASNFSVQSPGGKENCQKLEPTTAGHRFRTSHGR